MNVVLSLTTYWCLMTGVLQCVDGSHECGSIGTILGSIHCGTRSSSHHIQYFGEEVCH